MTLLSAVCLVFRFWICSMLPTAELLVSWIQPVQLCHFLLPLPAFQARYPFSALLQPSRTAVA
jgi:hypothetical protein